MHTMILLASGLPNPKHAPEQSWFVPFLIGFALALFIDLTFRHRPWK